MVIFRAQLLPRASFPLPSAGWSIKPALASPPPWLVRLFSRPGMYASSRIIVCAREGVGGIVETDVVCAERGSG